MTTKQTCQHCRYHKTETWGDNWIDQRVTEDHCNKQQWEFEEPTPSPAEACKLYEVALPEYVDENIDLDELLVDDFEVF